MRRAAVAIIALTLALFATHAGSAGVDVTLSRATVPLNGPWAFRLGDDPRWASATFDDGDWERVDLTPKAGAHDGDVGLPDYVPGWTARGHGGRWGHAWYRLRVHWSGNAGRPLVLLGPTLVDDAYEIYWNGKRLGGTGDFSTTPPRIYGVRPQLFELGEPGHAADGVLAIHVYLSKESAESPEAGGVHVAPILAERTDGQAHYLAQWWRTFWGYVVDLVEPLALLGVAIFALSLRRFAPGDPFLPYAAGAIAAIAASRINQPLYFWTGAESLQTLIWARFVVFGPLAIVLWIMACNRLGGGRQLRLDALAWVSGMVAGIAALPGIDAAMLHSGAQLVLLALAGWAMWRGARVKRQRVLALSTMLVMAVALFPAELSAIGIPGIWFPFGVGVSRTQFALALAIPLLGTLIHLRASPSRPHTTLVPA